MDTIQDLLERSEQLDESHRVLLIKLIWLHGQAEESVQRDVSAFIAHFLPRAREDLPQFISAVQTLVDELEQRGDAA